MPDGAGLMQRLEMRRRRKTPGSGLRGPLLRGLLGAALSSTSVQPTWTGFMTTVPSTPESGEGES
jgi:hypothetical protein